MLTGYNTDIDRGDLVVHVQTEDKGESNPCVESLIYVGGRVVASKRSSYAEQLTQGAEEAAISRFMDQQHRKIVLAVQSGRLDDRIRRAIAAGNAGAAQAVVRRDESTGAPAAAGSLSLDLSTASPLVVGGTVAVWVRASYGTEPAAAVEIQAEMVSALQEPVLLARGATDEQGLFKSDLSIPDIEAGTGAVIFSGRGQGSVAEVVELL